MSELRVNTVSDAAGSGRPTITQGELCTARIRWEYSAGSPVDVESFNVSSQSDVGTGDVGTNFTNAMSSAAAVTPVGEPAIAAFGDYNMINDFSTNGAGVVNHGMTSGTTATDVNANLLVFGDLA